MSNIDQQLDFKTSFNLLKKTARNDIDVCNWLMDNRACLPSVPERFKPYLEFTSPTATHLLAYDEHFVKRQVNMHFRATLPASVENTVKADQFMNLTGQSVDILRENSNEETFDTELRMELSACEWPYVACEVALYVWSTDTIKAELTKKLLPNAWNIVFPHLPWETVDQMYISGLLPHDPDEFKAWAMASSPMQTSTIILPESITI